MSTLTTFVQHSFGRFPRYILATAVREEKEVKRIQIRKQLKLSLFADDMTLYIEDPKDATRKLLALNE